MHHFGIKIFTLMCILVLVSRQQFDRIRVRKVGQASLGWYFLEVVFGALDFIIDYDR